MSGLAPPLAASVLVTLALMITSHALPRWYTASSALTRGTVKIHFGLWRSCVEFDTTIIRPTVCVNFLGDGVSNLVNIDAALRSAEAFAVIAVVLVGIGALLSTMIEVQPMPGSSLWRIPRIVFGIGGGAMAIAAFSFIAFINKTNLNDQRGTKYDAGFIIAWVSVVTSIASAIIAHKHHSAKAFESSNN